MARDEDLARDSGLPPAPPSVWAWRFCVLAWLSGAVLLGLLVYSATRFAKLPPAAQSAASLGWERGIASPHVVVEDVDGSTAWVLEGRDVCRVRTADGRALRCDPLPIDAYEVRQHVLAPRRLLLVATRRTEPDHRHEMRALVARPDAPPLDSGWQPVADVAVLEGRGAGWNARLERFETYAYDYKQPAVVVVPVSLDAVVGAPEKVAVEGAALREGPLFPFVIAGDPPALLVTGLQGGDVSWLRGAARGPVVAHCTGYPEGCVAPVSALPYDAFAMSEPALWVGPTGEAQRATPVPSSTAGGSVHWQFRAVERAGRVEAVAWPGGGEVDALVVRVPWGEPLALHVRRAGMEEVTVVTDARGRAVRVARGASSWSPVPHDDGLLLLSTSYGGRVVALDKTLARVDAAPGALRNLWAVAREHARYAIGEVALFVGLLVVLPVLLVACGPRLRRRARSPGGRAIATLVVCDAAAAWLFFTQWAYLFPP
jgi:hypothetical protein